MYKFNNYYTITLNKGPLLLHHPFLAILHKHPLGRLASEATALEVI